MGLRAYSPLPNPSPLPRVRPKPANDPWKRPYRPGPRPKVPFGQLPPPRPPYLPIKRPPVWTRMFGRLLGPIGWALFLYDLYELYQWYQQPGVGYDMPPGWSCHRTCNGLTAGTMDGIVTRFNCSPLACDAGHRHPSTFTVAPGSVTFKLYYTEPSGLIPGYLRFITTDIYEYLNAPSPLPSGVVRPAPDIVVPLPAPVVFLPPWIDPNFLPVHQPVPNFRPPPVPLPPQPNWWRQPGDPTPMLPEGPWPVPVNPAYPPLPGESWPTPADAPGVGPAPWQPHTPRPPLWAPPVAPVPVDPLPVRPPRPWFPTFPLPEVPQVPAIPTAPWQRPVWELPPIHPNPDSRFPRVPEPATHATRPPPPRVKENKRRSPAAGLLWWAANAATERTDYIKAAYNALPWQVRRFKATRGPNKGKWMDKDISPQDRLNRIHDHIEKLDIYEFAKNVAVNNAQDFALGKVSQQVQKLNGLLAEYGYARPAGIETGPAL